LKAIGATKISTLAQEIIEKCKLIHSSRQSEVEQLLYYLQKRQASQGDDGNYLLKQALLIEAGLKSSLKVPNVGMTSQKAWKSPLNSYR
jgi:Kinesin-associated protein (KAP)